MRQLATERRTARTLERVIARGARRPSRAMRRRSRGQTLVIFALAFTILIGFIGLTIDGVRVYDLYARMQRAAEAGALAGVIYMPDNYTANIAQAPFDNAVCRALQEVSKNGFGAYCNPASQPANITSLCPSGNPTSVEIAICPELGFSHNLKVYITESINVLFLGALGVGPITLTASAEAQYLPPVDVAVDPGGPGSTGGWGTLGTFNGASCPTKNSVRCWGANINGPGELEEQGDPLVTCQEGPSGLNPANPNGSTDSVFPLTLGVTPVGMPTNHPQYPLGSKCPNPDAANAFTGPIYYDPNAPLGSAPQRQGYAYLIQVPTGDTENLWVWNAPFSPASPKSCNGRVSGPTVGYDTFYYYNCQGSTPTSYPLYPNTACSGQSPYTCTEAKLFFSVTYTIYKITGVNSPGGTPIASFTAWPYEVGDHGCADWLPASTAAPYNNPVAGCATPNCVIQWCPIGNQLGDATVPAAVSLSTGLYRVMVVTSDYGDPTNYNVGYGGHSYSLKLCPPGATQATVISCTPAKFASIGGWTLSDALFVFPGNGGGQTQITEYPLGVVDSSFAGRTLDIQLFDPGDLLGTNSSTTGQTIYAVAPPTAASDPCKVTTAQLQAAGFTSSNFLFPYNERNAAFSSALQGLVGSNTGDIIYNGLWVSEQIAVPSNYTTGSWTLCAIAPQTNDGDVLGIKVEALGQSPVHLV